MREPKENYLSLLWKLNRLDEFGAELSSILDSSDRPSWCAALLGLVYFEDTHQYCEELRSLCLFEKDWILGKGVFQSIRERIIERELVGKVDVELYVFEIIAKVLYNSSFPKFGFDDNTFMCLPSAIKKHLERTKQPKLSLILDHLFFRQANE